MINMKEVVMDGQTARIGEIKGLFEIISVTW
jgi:hypothetical protein